MHILGWGWDQGQGEGYNERQGGNGRGASITDQHLRICSIGLKPIDNLFSVEASETELGFSGSDGCYSSHTCSPIPKAYPKRDVIFRAIALCYIADENLDGPKKDFWEGNYHECQKTNTMAMKVMIMVTVEARHHLLPVKCPETLKHK